MKNENAFNSSLHLLPNLKPFSSEKDYSIVWTPITPHCPTTHTTCNQLIIVGSPFLAHRHRLANRRGTGHLIAHCSRFLLTSRCSRSISLVVVHIGL